MASRYRRLRGRMLKAMFKMHAEVYERSGGRIGAWLGLPTLLLTVVGRKSGKRYSTPLVYFQDGDNYVVVGSDGAARRDPQWWKNLAMNPEGSIRVGRRQLDIEAHLAKGEERARLWEHGKKVNPMWSRYQERTERELPVVVLTPKS